MQYLDAVSGSLAVLVICRSFSPGGYTRPQQPWSSSLATVKLRQVNVCQPGSGKNSCQVVDTKGLSPVTVRCRSDPLTRPEARGP